MLDKKEQARRVQDILRKPNIMDEATKHVPTEDKCAAILAWAKATEVNFDTSFVDNVHNYIMTSGKCSDKQTSAIDKIISRFSINLTEWAP